MESENPK